jgi:diacylglycerol kinase (ATP)
MPSSPDQADAVLLFGGDGTIHRHLAQLVQLGLPVLVVPAGSGNDFARALGLPRVRDSSAAWRRFCQGTNNVRLIDLGRGMITPVEDAGGVVASHPLARESALGTRYFCCAAGVGLDGEVSRRASELPGWLRGHGGYALSLAPALFRFAPLPVRIRTVDNATDTAPNPDATSDLTWLTRSDRPTILAAFANTRLTVAA